MCSSVPVQTSRVYPLANTLTKCILEFDPDTARALAIVSHAFKKVADEFLGRLAERTVAGFPDRGAPLYNVIHFGRWQGSQPIPGVTQKLAARVRQSPGIEIGGGGDSIKLNTIPSPANSIAGAFTRPGSQFLSHSRYNRNASEFLLSIPRQILAFDGCYNSPAARILSLPQIRRHNQRIHEDALQILWSGICACWEANPVLLPADAPDRGTPPQVIGAWMREHADILGHLNLSTLRFLLMPLKCIPQEMGLLSNLQELKLVNTGLCVVPSGALKGLGRLEKLYIDGGYFRDGRLGETGLVPGSLEGLNQLRELSVRACGLRRLVPGVFAGLTQLVTLDLGDNWIEELLPGSFDGLSELSCLKLSSNWIKRFFPGAFQGLPQLEILNLTYNGVEALLPPDLFQGLSALRRLDFAAADLYALPPHLFHGLPLQTLFLWGNEELLFFYRNLLGSDPAEATQAMEAFFSYECRTVLARFYQHAAGGLPLEELRESFLALDEDVKIPIFKMVYDRVSRQEPFDLQWGEKHGFENMKYFYHALKTFVKNQYETWPASTKSHVENQVLVLAQAQRGTDLLRLGERLAQENIPRLIDAMALSWHLRL